MATGAPALAAGQTGETEPGPRPSLEYPRRYRGRQLAMLAFPLGGIGTGSISLGGRGQLRDWEVFNRPDKGLKPSYALPSLWVQKGDVLEGDAPAATRELEIDYARYAAAEAALGWVNWRGRLDFPSALFPAQVAGPLLDDLDQRLRFQGARIAHLKCVVTSEGIALKASLTANGGEPDLEGDLQAPATRRMEVLVNLRALGPPEELLQAVRGAIDQLPGRVTILREQAFQPAAPRPERRIARR